MAVLVVSDLERVENVITASSTQVIEIKYRDTTSSNSGTASSTLDKVRIDLTNGNTEQILAKSVRFKIGGDVFIDRDANIVRNVDPTNNSGTLSGSIQYGTGLVELNSWTPGVNNSIQLQSLSTTTDLPPVSKIDFRVPTIPIRAGSLSLSVATLEHGNLTLQFDNAGVINTTVAHGIVNYETGFATVLFYQKTEITNANRADIESQNWYDVALEYDEGGKTYIDVPIWVDPSSLRYNAVAYKYIPLDSSLLGLSPTRLPVDGRVPIFRRGEIAVVCASKSHTLPGNIAGTTYDLPHQRIAWAEVEDSLGLKLNYDLYEVDYDYGRVRLNGDFVLGNLVPPLLVRYRYQDMALVQDVQISGQITLGKPLTHSYDAADTIVGSCVAVSDLQARYANKFVQGTWSNLWSDESSGAAISANYNDALYPIGVTNRGAIQERWAIVFTDATSFRCIGEYSGLIGTGTTAFDFEPNNPVTNAPYFTLKKEGFGSGWASGNVIRFNTIAAMQPIWAIRTVKQSEPSVISDKFQIMFRGDIDREP